MDCSLKCENAIAPQELYSYLGTKISKFVPVKTQVFTPQRKARYSDKQRIRLKDAKSWALRQSGCSNTAEIKKYLKILGKKLDLRLTSAWVAIYRELAGAIKNLWLELNGDRQRLSAQAIPVYLEPWEAAQVLEIAQNMAQLPFGVPTSVPTAIV